MPQERSAGVIVFMKTKEIIHYLLLHYTAGHWDFPKGNIEEGETEKETVRREIKEETGLEDIIFIPDFEEKIEYFYKRDGKTIYKTVVFFLAETKTEKINLSFEHTDSRWLPYNQAIEKVTFRTTKEVFKKAHDFLGRK